MARIFHIFNKRLQYLKQLENQINLSDFVGARRLGIHPVPFLGDIVKEVEGFRFREEIFDKYYRTVEQLIYNETIDLSIWLLIKFFDECEFNRIMLDDYHIIRHPTIKECEELWHNESKFTRGAIGAVYPTNYILEIVCPVDKSQLQDSYSKIYEEIQKSVWLLRLYDCHGFRFEMLKDVSIVSKYPKEYGTSLRLIDYPAYNGLNISLSIQDTKKLKKFWQQFYPINVSDNALKIAIDRFSKSFENKNMNYAFVDVITGLEALYLTGAQDLSYQLALKSAILLAEDTDTRKSVFRFMKKAYGLRSRIVHGEYSSDPKDKAARIDKGEEKKPFYELFYTTRKYLSESIKKFLLLTKSGRSRDKILELIEHSIFAAKYDLLTQEFSRITKDSEVSCYV